ncbi:hypothetical protein [Psychrobium sp. 1_MG-2023]|uniref:hypothetical protein n=1 Tax=Psychrobium sp. 1_MG-2023 TaxID=3062624 RepID=UPI000C337928|nr:hypothetical protein [Psychrobium sp. 1_MG-2023]MDP2561552.1 hypothetical protein [Psychrobium sp. 1_MG-2023]PKF55015.1 hypothetical protein CW748_14645 [Alteromonadales bacterium alter-6D02]
MVKKIVLLSILALLGCQESAKNSPINKMGQDSTVTFMSEHLTMTVPKQMNAETLFPVSLHFSQPVRDVKAKLISINMDMGTMPIIFSAQENGHLQDYHSQVIVGSCTEPSMEWRMLITWLQGEQRMQHSQIIEIKR